MGKYRRVMLNTNVFCRPFDDLTDTLIKKEALFSEEILKLAESKQVEIITSDILYGELSLISDQHKMEIILSEIESVTQERIRISGEVHALAWGLKDFVFDYSDSLHIAFAATSNCDCLVTCDKQLIKIRGKIESFLLSKGIKLAIATPEEFIESFA